MGNLNGDCCDRDANVKMSEEEVLFRKFKKSEAEKYALFYKLEKDFKENFEILAVQNGKKMLSLISNMKNVLLIELAEGEK